MIDAKLNQAFVFSQRIIGADELPAVGLAPTVTVYNQGTSQIVITGTMTYVTNGFYVYNWTPAVIGLFDYAIDETTIPRRYSGTLLVGVFNDIDLSTRIANIANKGQDAALGAGAGSVSFTNNLMIPGVGGSPATPVINTFIRVFQAQTIIRADNNRFTNVLFSSEVAQTTTSSTGSFTLNLNPGYYVIQAVDSNNALDTWYMNVISSGNVVVQTTEINP